MFENDRSVIAEEGALLWPVRQPVPQQLSNEVLTEIIPQPWLMRGSSAANEPQPLSLLRRIKKQLKHPQVSGVFQRQEQKWSLNKLQIFRKPACKAVNRHPNMWLTFISFLISPAVKCWATSVIKKWGSLRREIPESFRWPFALLWSVSLRLAGTTAARWAAAWATHWTTSALMIWTRLPTLPAAHHGKAKEHR